VALVNPSQMLASDTTGNVGVLPTIDQVVETYVELINTSPVQQRLIAAGVPRTYVQLNQSLHAKRQPNTTLIDITYDDSDPEVALQVAQAVIPAFNSALDVLEAKVQVPGSTAAQNRLQAIVSWDVPAAAPVVPVSPKPLVNGLVAVLAGLAAGSSLAFLLEYLDTTIKSEYEVPVRTELPLLGAVVMGRPLKGTKAPAGLDLVTVQNPRNPLSESYRAIRTNVMFAMGDRDLRTIVVTSSIPAEGKTTTACNLAVTLAQAGKRVILVDADFRRPTLHKIFNRHPNIGLGNLLIGDEPERNVLINTDVANLRVVCSGATPPNPSEMLGSAAMDRAIEALKQQADVIILDTPPVRSVTDATILSGLADGVVLVVEQGRTGLAAVLRSRDTLSGVRANLLGIVLNKVSKQSTEDYYYYYYYGDKGKAGSNGAGGVSLPVPAPPAEKVG
jgi:capsular exopolysaccharide synthesis family protein